MTEQEAVLLAEILEKEKRMKERREREARLDDEHYRLMMRYFWKPVALFIVACFAIAAVSWVYHLSVYVMHKIAVESGEARE